MAYYKNYRLYKRGSIKQKKIDLYSGRFYFNNYEEINDRIEELKEELKIKEEVLSFLCSFKVTGKQNIELKNRILNNKNNYKKGVKYIFKKKLKDNFQKILESIYNDLNNNINFIDDKLRGVTLDVFDSNRFEEGVNILIERLNGSIKNYYKDIDILKKEFFNRKTRFLRKEEIAQEKIAKQKRKQEKEEQIKGLAHQKKEKARQLASILKSKVEINETCPYCGEIIMEPHVDHIYPISKGGLSTKKNMVMVCSSCNLKKRDLTLSQFIRKYNLDRDFIETNLLALNKLF